MFLIHCQHRARVMSIFSYEAFRFTMCAGFDAHFHPANLSPSLLPAYLGFHYLHPARILANSILLMYTPVAAVLRKARLRKANRMDLVFSGRRIPSSIAEGSKRKSHKIASDDPGFGESNLRKKVVGSSNQQFYGTFIVPRRKGGENRITFPHTFFIASL